MAFQTLAKVLEDRVVNHEQRYDKELGRLDAKIDRNFRINVLTACVAAIPAMQACGVPTKVIIPILLKALLGQ